MVPILSKRLDMDEEETQKSLIHHENEKRYEQLKERSDSLKQEIAQVMIKCRLKRVTDIMEFTSCGLHVTIRLPMFWNQSYPLN